MVGHVVVKTIDERMKKSHVTKKSKDLIYGYFQHIAYDENLICTDTILDYFRENDCNYLDAIRAYAMIKGICVRNLFLHASLFGKYSTQNLYMEILKACGEQKEADKYITIDEWKQYEEEMENLCHVEEFDNEAIMKIFLLDEFVWHGITRNELRDLSKKDIKIGEDFIEIKKGDKCIKIKNKLVAESFPHFVDVDDLSEEFKNRGKFRDFQLKTLEHYQSMQKVINSKLNIIYYSGEMYRYIHSGETIVVGQKAMQYYYEEIARIMYQ